MTIHQNISPEKNLFFTGETVTFSLSGIPSGKKGKAVLRTNIGGSAAKIAEQIEKTQLNRTPKGSEPSEKKFTYSTVSIISQFSAIFCIFE